MIFKYSSIVLAISIFFFLFTNKVHAQSWTQLSTAGTLPDARVYHTAVYDSTNNRMPVYGGEFSQHQLSVLDHANGLGGTPTWIRFTTTNDPGLPRTWHTAIYDTNHNRMTIFGGFDGSNALNDVWVLSTANGIGGNPAWTHLFPTGSAPTSRYAHSAVYDSSHNRMIMFGGNYGNYTNDLWILTNANGLDTTTSAWIHLFPTGTLPAPRQGHSTFYDSVNNRMILFGGSASGGELNDLWVLSNANGLDTTTSAWTQLSPTGSLPTTRAFFAAAYNPTKNRVTIFSGNNNGNYLTDTWVLSTANGIGGNPVWSQISPTGASSTTKRVGTSTVYDIANSRMIIFAGYNIDIGYLDDTWVLDNADTVPINDWMDYSSYIKPQVKEINLVDKMTH